MLHYLSRYTLANLRFQVQECDATKMLEELQPDT